MSSASVQWVFYRSSSKCRCISDVSVGRKVISASYSSTIFSSPPRKYIFKSKLHGDSLVAQWLTIHLPMQRTWV